MHRKLSTVVILHSDVKRSYFANSSAYETEKYALRDAQATATYAKQFANSVFTLPANGRMVTKLLALRPDVVVNLVDSVEGDDTRTPEVSAVLDFLKIPYTGNPLSPLLLCYDKFFVKMILEQHGIPTPKGYLVKKDQKRVVAPHAFPVISKLNTIHGSVGLTKDSISQNMSHLTKRIRSLQKQYKTDILVEEYIVGQEVSAFVVDNGTTKKVYMAEDIMEHGVNPYAIASYEMRWEEENPVIESKKYGDKKVEKIVVRAFDALGMKGYSKFDLRVREGIPYFIDINPNPAFAPPECDAPIAKVLKHLYGVSFESLLASIITAALKKK